jgi:hypothetical protein
MDGCEGREVKGRREREEVGREAEHVSLWDSQDLLEH